MMLSFLVPFCGSGGPIADPLFSATTYFLDIPYLPHGVLCGALADLVAYLHEET